MPPYQTTRVPKPVMTWQGIKQHATGKLTAR
ncbi:hypothetical protein A2U01_0117513, partial [Trifolium medium]|nr:hypothetical protein [Trifolium medium]